MGDYASDAFQRDLYDYADRWNDDYWDDWDGGYSGRFKRKSVEFKAFKIKGIEKETDKAWFVEIPEGTKIWLPKSKCRIHNNYIAVPEWLCAIKKI